ncbi:hypothetical protein CR513_07428, partial [Mucuna pruriens]
MGEKEIMVSTPLPTDYIEEDEEALETSFQALEIVGTTITETGSDDTKPSKAVIMAAKVLITNGFKPGKGPNTKTFPRINNTTLVPNDTDKSSRQDEGEETEEEALRELERLLDQEKPKLQAGTKEIEIINLNKGEETKEIQIGKLTPPDFKQKLTKLLREYEDIFAWSYRDMPGLDTTIVEHKLSLIPNAIPVRQ